MSFPVLQNNLSLPFFGIRDLSVFVLCDDSSLLPWQGAVLWEYETMEGHKYPVIQIRKSRSKGFFSFYEQEEVFSHELVHAARFGFNQPLFEEVLAYQTSSSLFRKFVGPLFIYPLEANLFALLSLILPFVWIFFDALWPLIVLFGLVFYFGTRLCLLHMTFYFCKKTLMKVGLLPESVLPLMVRLFDREIMKLAFSRLDNARKFLKNHILIRTRIGVLLSSYFKHSLDV